MRNKKLFNRLMAIIMCSTLTVSTPIMTYATETENVEETLQTAEETQADENGFVIKGSVLTDYVGTAEHVVVPEGVESIGVYAFKGCSGLKEVTIPDGVTRIEANAFEECTTLTKITIPDSVTIIGAYAFNGCSGLTEIAIPNGVTTLGRATFGGCTSLTKVTIPSSVTTFTDRVFIGCTSLTEITIPDSVKTIGDYTFSGCSQLKEITIPNTVTYIGDGAFYGCSGLTISGEKDSVAHQYAQENGIEFKVLGEENEDSEQSEFIIENGVLTRYVGTAEHVVVPEGVTEIAMYGFSGCQMVSVKLPKSLQKVGWHGFSGCENLTNVEFLSSSLSMEDMAFIWCGSLKSVELPNGLITIPRGTFAYCSSLENIVIPDSVAEIGYGAFSACTSLGKIAIPDSVTTIDETAFAEEWGYEGELPPEGQMDITICGTEGSYAQQYAETYGFKFELLGEEPETPEQPEVPEQPQTPIYTTEQFDKLLEENTKSDVVIEANDNITITFGKGTMKEVDGVTSYDFTATTTNDYKASKLPTSVKEGEFVLKISYNYSGKLPANASVKIFVGKEYNGKTLYYSLLKEDGTLTETQKAVVEDGYITVTQSHCSDWIITTTNPASENDQNNGGQDNNNQNDNSNGKDDSNNNQNDNSNGKDDSNNNQNDNSDGKDDSNENKNESPDTGENNAWVSGILLVMSVVLLGIARKRKIS